MEGSQGWPSGPEPVTFPMDTPGRREAPRCPRSSSHPQLGHVVTRRVTPRLQNGCGSLSCGDPAVPKPSLGRDGGEVVTRGNTPHRGTHLSVQGVLPPPQTHRPVYPPPATSLTPKPAPPLTPHTGDHLPPRGGSVTPPHAPWPWDTRGGRAPKPPRSGAGGDPHPMHTVTPMDTHTHTPVPNRPVGGPSPEKVTPAVARGVTPHPVGRDTAAPTGSHRPPHQWVGRPQRSRGG